MSRKVDPEKAAIILTARKLYVEGASFRVVKEGARLEGLVTFGASAWGGWSRPLRVGEVLLCRGWLPGWGSDSIPHVQFTGKDVPPNADWVHVWPMSGLWRPYPLEGYLEKVEDDI